MINNKMARLDTLFVIVKKYNGKTYYYGNHGVPRGREVRYISDSRYINARYAHVYDSEEKAKQLCDSLNSTRKKLKYRVEKASKHFISNFSLSLNYSTAQVDLVSTRMSIQDYKTHRQALTDNKKQLEDILKTVQGKILEGKHRQAQIPQQMRQQIAQIEQQYMSEIDKNAAHLSQLDTLQSSLQNFDLNSLEEYRTVEDNTFKVLYGQGAPNGNT